MAFADWAPTIADVGALLRSRTTDTNGVEQGTFTAGTRPTDGQVGDLVIEAQQDIAVVVGETVHSSLNRQASSLAALGTALLIELSYFPEQVASGRSPYAQLKELYDARYARLVMASEALPDDGGTDVIVTETMPVYGFPENAGGQTGWGSRW